MFLEELVANNVEWIVVAVIGGSVIGFLLSFIYLCIKAVRLKKVTLI